MGEAAVAAAKAVGYVNAGTIEFILDAEGNFYFLEMNTRIQVEHPITELTTGIDLVQWQLRIARGEELSFAQKDLAQRGHSIECRIYAEDETQNFMPSSGVIALLRQPSGPGIRNDTGVYEGWEVTPFYDPILSKLVVFGEHRDAARARMLRALDDYVVHGVKTGIDLHRRILTHDAFVRGNTNTAFLEEHAAVLQPARAEIRDDAFVAAALADELGVGVTTRRRTGSEAAHETTPWESGGNWEIGGRR
jgi:acetyl/propionyl-CoA carboxylase alpha subunit